MKNKIINEITPDELTDKIKSGETFVVNVFAEWCPDCTERQTMYFPEFVRKLEAKEIQTYRLTVQKERLVFISDKHKKLTENFGGHGYPRTVLIIDGVIQSDSRVEVISREELLSLAEEFIKRAC